MRHIDTLLAAVFAMLLTACSSGLFSSVDTKKSGSGSDAKVSDSTATEQDSDDAEESSPECIAKAEVEESADPEDTAVEADVEKAKGKKAAGLHDGEEHGDDAEDSEDCHSEAEEESEVDTDD